MTHGVRQPVTSSVTDVVRRRGRVQPVVVVWEDDKRVHVVAADVEAVFAALTRHDGVSEAVDRHARPRR